VEANPQISDLRLEGLELQGRNPAVLLDFGGMIRGYAVDLAIETLRGLGVRDAQVQVGSDLRAIGDRSGQPWRVPIRRASGSGVLGVLHLRGDEAVSSLYANDRTFVYGGATYHSILDPRTGWPARDTLAVTVAHRDATTASAAAAALFLAGPQRWHEVAGALGLRYVLLVDGRGAVQLSPEMRDRFDLVERSATLSVAPPLGPPPAAQAAGASRPAGAGGERR
jgi:thiamine biosynthesis lipoprotein